jgi:hypothetical protein
MRHANPATFALALGIQLDDVTAATNGGEQQILISKDEAFTKFTEGVMLDDVAPEDYIDYVRASRLVVRDLQLSPGQLGLIMNGRVSVSVEKQCLAQVSQRFPIYLRLWDPSTQVNSVLQILKLWRTMNIGDALSPL